MEQHKKGKKHLELESLLPQDKNVEKIEIKDENEIKDEIEIKDEMEIIDEWTAKSSDSENEPLELLPSSSNNPKKGRLEPKIEITNYEEPHNRTCRKNLINTKSVFKGEPSEICLGCYQLKVSTEIYSTLVFFSRK